MVKPFNIFAVRFVPYFVVVLAGRQARLRPPPRLAQFLHGTFFNLSMGVQYDSLFVKINLAISLNSWHIVCCQTGRINSPKDTALRRETAM